MELMTTTINIRIKGEIGYIFSLIEHQLLRVILFSREYTHYKNGKGTPLKLKNVKYKNKVDMAFAAVKKVDAHLYKLTEPLFTFLGNMAEYRNIMIHGEYVWDVKDISQFEVWDVIEEDDADNTQHHQKVSKNVVDIADANTNLMMAYNQLVPISARFERYGLTQIWE